MSKLNNFIEDSHLDREVVVLLRSGQTDKLSEFAAAERLSVPSAGSSLLNPVQFQANQD